MEKMFASGSKAKALMSIVAHKRDESSTLVRRACAASRTVWCVFMLAFLPAACASPVHGTMPTARSDAEISEARLGSHRFRMPTAMFRYGIVPESDRRFELAFRMPELSAVDVEPAPGSIDHASMLAVEVVRMDGVPTSHVLSFWLGESPPGALPDPAGGDTPRIPGKPIYGLQPYFVAENTPKHGDLQDRFIGDSSAGIASTFIRCSRRSYDDDLRLVDGRPAGNGEGIPIAVCDHAFMLNDDIAVYMRYARLYLPQWHEIENGIATLLTKADRPASR